MKRTGFVGILLMALSLPTPAGHAAEGLKIGSVNFQQALNDVAQGKHQTAGVIHPDFECGFLRR